MSLRLDSKCEYKNFPPLILAIKGLAKGQRSRTASGARYKLIKVPLVSLQAEGLWVLFYFSVSKDGIQYLPLGGEGVSLSTIKLDP